MNLLVKQEQIHGHREQTCVCQGLGEGGLEKAVAPHSSVLAWRIPGMGEPGGLLSMESHRVGHD